MKLAIDFLYLIPVPYLRTISVIMLLTLYHVTLSQTFISKRDHTWQRSGCTKVVNVRDVNIPNCYQFRVVTNACRGYCKSYAQPIPYNFLLRHGGPRIISKSECCSIADTYEVPFRVLCRDPYTRNEFNRSITFKSAISCVCSICRHN